MHSPATGQKCPYASRRRAGKQDVLVQVESKKAMYMQAAVSSQVSLIAITRNPIFGHQSGFEQAACGTQVDCYAAAATAATSPLWCRMVCPDQNFTIHFE